jgi:hypothetical protein
MSPVSAPRDDVFVSVCFADDADTAKLLSRLEPLADALTAAFRYWEILIAVSEDADDDSDSILTRIANVRVLTMRRATPFYRRRVALTSEAIGDVVALCALGELAYLDVIDMIRTAADQDSIVIGCRRRKSLLTPLLRVLGRTAGFRVTAEDMLTAVWPRTILNQLLDHPDRELALRFPPADQALPVVRRRASATGSGRSTRDLGRRLSLIQCLLVSSAPIVLSMVAILSLLVVLSAGIFVMYALTVWLFLPAVQPGWFTTTLVISLTSGFLGAAIFGLAIGLQSIIDILRDRRMDDIVKERGATDLFGTVLRELNVEVATEPGPSVQPERMAVHTIDSRHESR